MSQKIIIPKGLINPNETTIIEIPEDVQNIETVVAKPVYLTDMYDSEETLENEYYEDVEEGKLNGFIDEEHLEVNTGRVVRTTQNYPGYKFKEINVYGDESSCTYSNTISKADVNEKFDEKNLAFPARNPKLNQVISVLDVLEKVELKRLFKHLRNYQCARRKLLFETSNIYNIDDICASLYGFY